MYLKNINGNLVKYTLQQLRRDYPNVSFPKSPSDEVLAQWNIYRCVVADAPIIDDTQRVEQAEQPVLQGDGTYVWYWSVIAKTQAEIDQEDVDRKITIDDLLDSPDGFAKALLKLSFQQENRIRVLEGRPEVTASQFRTYVTGQIE